jgi:hypothetical protein
MHGHAWISIFKFAYVASGAGAPARSRASWPLGRENSRKPRKLEKTEKTRENSRKLEKIKKNRENSGKLEKTKKTRARRSRSSSLGLAGALEMAARACSASLGRAKLLLRPARSGEIAAQACSVGLAGALDYPAQVSWMKRLAKKLFENAMLGSRLALFVYAPFVCASSMDMLGSTLVYIYIYVAPRIYLVL